MGSPYPQPPPPPPKGGAVLLSRGHFVFIKLDEPFELSEGDRVYVLTASSTADSPAPGVEPKP